MSVLWVKMNGILDKYKFNSTRILLDSRSSSSNIIVKHAQKILNKNTKTVRCIIQGNESNNFSQINWAN